MSRFAILGTRGFPSHYGGFETLVRYLAPHLVLAGHEVVVYGRGGEPTTSLTDGVVCRVTRGIDSKSLSTLTYGFTASRAVLHDHCDAALVLNVANGLYLPALARRGIPTAVNVDGVEWKRGKWGTLARSAFLLGAKLTARYADELILDSESLRAVWRDGFGRDGVYIPYGARPVDRSSPERIRELGLEPGRYVLVVARLVPENNVSLCLDAVALSGVDAVTVVVGAASSRSLLVKRLEGLQQSGRVIWLGRVEDDALLDELWSNCGVYWHGHSVGGTNPALLQALAAGAPTLALDTPYNREVLAGHGSQLVPLDAEAVAVELRRVLSSRDIQRTLALAGRDAISGRYTWESVCASYLTLLEGLAVGSQSAPKGLARNARTS